MAPALHCQRVMRIRTGAGGVFVPERFDQARLEATFRACRALRHELACEGQVADSVEGGDGGVHHARTGINGDGLARERKA